MKSLTAFTQLVNQIISSKDIVYTSSTFINSFKVHAQNTKNELAQFLPKHSKLTKTHLTDLFLAICLICKRIFLFFNYKTYFTVRKKVETCFGKGLSLPWKSFMYFQFLLCSIGTFLIHISIFLFPGKSLLKMFFSR